MKFLPVLSFPVARKLGHSVGEFVKSSSLQAETMSWIARNTPVDAVLGPMDLSIEAEAFGAAVRFGDDEIPAITGQLVEDEEGADALAMPPPGAGRCEMAAKAVAKAKAAQIGKPVYAGMIGPFSLTGRLMDVTEVMYLMADEPETVEKVLEKATEFLIGYGKALKAAGADGLFMAEPLAGVVSPADLSGFSAPYVTRIVGALQDERFPVVYHNCGTSVVKAADAIFAQGAAGCHFGNAVDLKTMLELAPAGVAVMGNVDPVNVLARGTPDDVRAACNALKESCGGHPNFVLSSGCDIPASTPWENLEAFFEAAK